MLALAFAEVLCSLWRRQLLVTCLSLAKVHLGPSLSIAGVSVSLWLPWDLSLRLATSCALLLPPLSGLVAL